MNEGLLIIAVVAVILITQFLLRQLRQPMVTYVRLTCTILLIAFVWGFGEQNKWPVKLIMTAVVIGSFISMLKEYRKLHAHSGSDQNG